MKYLIIGPGGMAGIKYMGALVRLKEQGLLHDIEEISGSSVGSIIGLLYIVYKGQVEKIVQESLEFNGKEIVKPNIKNLLYKFGLVDPSLIKDKLIEIIKGDVTFKELYERWPIKLHVATYELVSNRTIYMSVDTTPELSVVQAVVRSIRIPFVFVPEKSASEVFMDGSTFEGSPTVPFLRCPPSDVIEIRMDCADSGSVVPRDIMGFMAMCISRFMSNQIVLADPFKLIEVQCSRHEILNFGASREEKLKMYLDGYSTQ